MTTGCPVAGEPGGLVMYAKNSISKKVIEIPTEMKEVIWIGVLYTRY
jgi:hypothetical protein